MKSPKTVFQGIFAILFLLCGGNVKSQVWERGYPNTEAIEANVVNTPDGGFLFSNNGRPLIKTDADGNLLWEFFTPDSLDNVFAGSVSVHPDGNYVVVGGANITVPNYRKYDFAAKLDPNGNLIWFKTFPSFGGLYGQSVAVAADGGLFIGNQYNSLIKTDANGNLLWQNTNYYVEELVAAADGGVIIMAYDYLSSDPNAYIYKVSSSGNFLWAKTSSLPSQGFVAKGMAATNDGGFVITGVTTTVNNPGPYTDLVVQKFDANGNRQWSHVYNAGGTQVGENIAQTQDGGYIVTGWQDGRYLWLWHLDPQGNQLWEKGYFVGEGLSVKEVPSGGYIMLARRLGGALFLPQNNGLHLVRTDAQGNVFENKIIGTLNEDANQDCQFQPGEQGLAGWAVHATGSLTVYGITDANGEFELDVNTDDYQLSFWPPQDYHQPCQPGLTANFATAPATIDLGNLPALSADTAIVTVSGPVFQDLDGDCEYDLGEPLLPNVQVGIRSEDGSTELHQLTDANGQYSFQVPAGEYYAVYISTSIDNPYCVPCCIDFCNFNYLDGSVPVSYNLGMTCTVPAPQTLTGLVFFDENENCQPDFGEQGIENGWLLHLVKAGTQDSFFLDPALIGGGGNFSIQVDTGSYFLTVTPPNYLYIPCQFVYNVVVGPGGAPPVYIPLMPLADCPKMTVDIGSGWLRPCFNSRYSVRYCNEGVSPADDAYVQVTFPPALTVQASQIPGTQLPGNVWQFPIGDVPVDSCGYFWIDALLDCDEPVGLTYCVEAHVFPDSICGPGNAIWDGSSVELSADCIGDSVVLTISNAGWGAMSQPLNFIVVEDNVLIRDSSFQLPAGGATSLTVFPNGATIVLSSQQSSGHPSNAMPLVFVEGCGGDSISLGFVNQYPMPDQDETIAIECDESVNAFDPNTKEAQPKGLTDAHFIENTTDLTYQITFQNLGTAPAETVVILDTLSQYLDTSRLQLGASSHPYLFELLPQNVLKFTFADIQLPHAGQDFDGSIGWVKYRVKQQTNNQPNTEIHNRAGIYFDFNPPVITNTLTHRIPSPINESTQTVSICAGEAWQGVNYEADAMLGDTVHYPFFDSVHITSIDVMPVYESSFSVNICNGSAYVFGDASYSLPGTYTQVFAAQNGCDSTVTLNLTVTPQVINNLSLTLCIGSSIIVNGTVYNEANPTGMEVFPNGSFYGCDSIVQVSLAFFPAAISQIQTEICPWETIVIQGEEFSAINPIGTIVLANASEHNCDSIINIALTILPLAQVEVDTAVLSGTIVFGVLVEGDTSFVQNYRDEAGCVERTVNVDVISQTVVVPSRLSQFTIAPNPAADLASLRGQLTSGAFCGAKLMDAYGRTIVQLFDNEWIAGSFERKIDLSGIPAGLYFVSFAMDGERRVLKLVVE